MYSHSHIQRRANGDAAKVRESLPSLARMAGALCRYVRSAEGQARARRQDIFREEGEAALWCSVVSWGAVGLWFAAT